MDYKKAGQLLDRINALHKSLTLDGEEEISAIERDLMLSYLRRLYEQYQQAGSQAVKASAPRPKPAASKRPAAPAPAPAPAPPPAPKPAPAPAPPKPVAKAPVEEKPPVAPPAPKPAPAPAPAPPPAPKKPTKRVGSKKVEALFALPAAKELSDRLAQQPIKDLTRALTINNRVQFANVLFAGNSDLMNSVLQRLNSFSSLDEAKSTLIDLAEQNNWADEEQAPVAQEFIKLVSRRYV